MTARKRIMVLEVSPLVPQAKVYATWNPSDKGANVVLSSGNLVASQSSTTIDRVRATIRMVAGEHYWETVMTVIPNSGHGTTSGVADGTEAIATGTHWGFTGVTSGGVHITGGSGNTYYNSTIITSLSTCAVNTRIGHLYNADTGVYMIRKNGGSWLTVFTRIANSAEAWYPAASLGRGATQWTANFGATAFTDVVPEGARAGVYSEPDPVATLIRLSSSQLNTGASDTPANASYDARISGAADLSVSREASCYVWNRQSQSSRGSVRIVNADGALDGWKYWTWKDAIAEIKSGYEGDLIGDFVSESVETVDKIIRSKKFVDIAFLDALSQLDVAVPREMYSTTNANSTTINVAYPKVWGRPQYCEGFLRTTAASGNDFHAYDLSDTAYPITVESAFDKGDVFDHTPTGADRDFYMTQNATGLRLRNVPAGKVLSHPTGPWLSTGSTLVVGGDPFAWGATGNPPTSWTVSGTAWDATNRFENGTLTTGTTGSARARATTHQVQMYNSATSLAAGEYVITFNVESVAVVGNIKFTLGTEVAFVRVDRVGSFSVKIKCASTSQLVMTLYGDGTWVMGAIDFIFKSMVCKAATIPEYLASWVSLFATTYAGVTVDSSVATFATQNGDWRLAHYSAGGKDETILSILRTTLDGWCGWLIPLRNGALTVGCVKEPSATADFSFDKTTIRSVVDTEDSAPGLTTRLAGKRNHSVTSIDQIAGGATNQVQQELQKEWLVVRSGRPTETRLGRRLSGSASPVVSFGTRHGDGSPPKGTFLQDESHIQTQINKVTTLWSKLRSFYSVELVLDAAIASLLEPGMTINITWHRYGLSGGKNLLLIGVQTGFWSRVVRLKLWG